jgi:hypothetical protein
MPHLVSSVNSPQPFAEVVPIVRCVADCHSSKALQDPGCVAPDRQTLSTKVGQCTEDAVLPVIRLRRGSKADRSQDLRSETAPTTTIMTDVISDEHKSNIRRLLQLVKRLFPLRISYGMESA